MSTKYLISQYLTPQKEHRELHIEGKHYYPICSRHESHVRGCIARISYGLKRMKKKLKE